MLTRHTPHRVPKSKLIRGFRYDLEWTVVISGQSGDPFVWPEIELTQSGPLRHPVGETGTWQPSGVNPLSRGGLQRILAITARVEVKTC